MEIWRVGYEEEKLPAVISRRTLTVALLLHLSVFVVFWLYAACHDLFHKEEEIIPIDLTVVVNENLDGKENEPPPLKKSKLFVTILFPKYITVRETITVITHTSAFLMLFFFILSFGSLFIY